MPSLLDLRRRIRSVKNTQQITKAMKMVAAAKLRRAQDRVIAARPYATSLQQMLANVASAGSGSDAVARLPLLQVRPKKKILVLLVTADRGLAGAFNANIIKGAQKFVDENRGLAIQMECVGRKGRDYFKRRDSVEVTGEHIGILGNVTVASAKAIAERAIRSYEQAEVDAVYLIYNEFKSVIAQKLVVSQVLPVALEEAGPAKGDYLYEQTPAELLGSLLPQYVETGIYRAMLESVAAEHAARMTAMDSASRNASEVIDKLTLYMNRVRQASITKEIIEVVSGAAALD
jgi:F-type H+-transporting ATPase subunit gamma